MPDRNSHSEPGSPREEETKRDPLDRLLAYHRGKRFPWWATLLLPFLLLLAVLYRIVRERVNWKAAAATIGVFELVVFPAEVFSVWRGHWVYNDARIWGPKILNVPIEEPLLYYVFPPLIVITAFCAIRMLLERKRRP